MTLIRIIQALLVALLVFTFLATAPITMTLIGGLLTTMGKLLGVFMTAKLGVFLSLGAAFSLLYGLKYYLNSRQ